jgi:hypothetical protein
MSSIKDKTMHVSTVPSDTDEVNERRMWERKKGRKEGRSSEEIGMMFYNNDSVDDWKWRMR